MKTLLEKQALLSCVAGTSAKKPKRGSVDQRIRIGWALTALFGFGFAMCEHDTSRELRVQNDLIREKSEYQLRWGREMLQTTNSCLHTLEFVRKSLGLERHHIGVPPIYNASVMGDVDIGGIGGGEPGGNDGNRTEDQNAGTVSTD